MIKMKLFAPPEPYQLKPFQVEGTQKTLDFWAKTGTRYDGSEQGTGKTVQALTAIQSLYLQAPLDSSYQCAERYLILCPSSMTLTWEDEAKKWTSFPHELIYPITTSTKLDEQRIRNSTIVICPYSLTINPKVLSALVSYRYDVLVMDEAHYLKSFKAKRTRAVLKHLWPLARYKLPMSGTPFKQGVHDLFSIYSKIMPEHFPSFRAFTDEYSHCRMIKIPGGREIPKFYGSKNETKLRRIQAENFYFRYEIDDVIKELTPKLISKVILPSSLSVETKKTKKENKAALEALERGEAVSSPPDSPLATLRRKQGLKKVKFISDYTTNLLEQGLPVILFAYHRDVIALYQEALAKYNPLTITGSTSPQDRFDAVKDFQTGKSLLFIGQLQAAGEGITLTAASTVIMAELDYSPSVMAQAISRAHRMGQKGRVQVFYFVVKDSLDEAIQGIVLGKAKAFKLVMEN